LSSRKGSHIEADLEVGFTHKLHEKTKQAVKRNERPKDRRAMEVLSVKPSEDQKKHESLDQRLVNLGWMAGRTPTFRKNHGPGYIRRTAEQFTIDEIADAPQPQTDWRNRAA